MRLANLFYYIIGGFLHNAKAILTTRRAGGLFVLQSSVFRINEKLHNVKQGLALTKEIGPFVHAKGPIFVVKLTCDENFTQ